MKLFTYLLLKKIPRGNTVIISSVSKISTLPLITFLATLPLFPQKSKFLASLFFSVSSVEKLAKPLCLDKSLAGKKTSQLLPLEIKSYKVILCIQLAEFQTSCYQESQHFNLPTFWECRFFLVLCKVGECLSIYGTN